VTTHGHSTTEALTERERRLLALLEKASEILAIMDANGKIVQESPNQVPLLGYSEGDLLGRDAFELLHPDDKDKALAAFQGLTAHPDAKRQMEVRLRTKQGEWRWMDVSATNCLNDAAVNGIIFNTRDINERKQAERALQYRLALEQLVASTSSRLANVSAAELDTVTNDVLAGVGQLLEADRCYLFQISDDFATADNTHEWCAAGVQPQIAGLHDVPTASFPWLRRQVLKGEPVHISSAANLPAQATATRRLMEAGRVRSVIIVPIRQAGKLTGFVGCDAVTAERRWLEEDVRLLRTIGEILADAQARRRAEQALRESEERYRRLVENLKGHHFIYRHDAQGKFTYISETVTAVLGFTPAEFLAHYSTYMTDHPVNQAVKQHTDLSLQGIRQPSYELNIWHKDGTDRWLEVQEVPIFDPAGNVIAVEGVAQDITGRKQIEEALQKNEAMLRSAFDNAPFEFWVRDRNGAVIFENAALVKQWGSIHGLRPEEAQIAPETLAIWQENNRRAIAGEIVQGKVQYTQHGVTRTFHNVVAPFRVGEEIQGILGFNIDITERKQTEEALRESETKYRRLHESMTDAFVSVDMAGRILEFNTAYHAMLGYSADELRRLTYVDLTPEKWRSFETRIVAEQILPRGHSDVYEKEYRRKDGTIFPVELRTFLLCDDKGQPAVMWAIVRDITERKQAETALQESERRYRELVENANSAIIRWKRDGTIAFFNEYAQKLFGYRADEVVGQHVGIIVPARESTGSDLSALVEEVAAHPERFVTNINENVCRDGRRIWMAWTNKPIHDDKGQVSEILAIGSDITLRKQAEDELAHQEKLLRSMGDNLPDGVTYRLISVPDGRTYFEYVSAGFEQLFELRQDMMLQDATSLYAMLHPDDSDEAMKAQQHSAETLTPFRHECCFNLPSGKTRWVRWHSMPEPLPDGGIAWNGVAIDITERKLTEEALLESEEQFRTMAEAVPQQICVMGQDSRPEYANRQRLDYTGISLEHAQAVGGWWEAVHPDDRSSLTQVWDQSRKTGLPFASEYRLRCASDGQYRWFLGRGVPLKDPQGQVLKWFVSATDIDEQKQLETILEQRVKQRTAQLQEETRQRRHLEQQILEITEREQRRISQDLHDSVGQRLAGAKFLTSSLGRRLARAKSPGASTAVRIRRELDTAIEEVRAIARGLHPVRHDPEGLVAALFDLTNSTTRLFHVRCRFECPRTILVPDQAVAMHLYHVAQEAVSNAVRHAKAKQIVISLRKVDAGIELQVRDNGRGLPSPSRRRKGMGLEIMKHRASVIGASITISRARNGGTILNCLLPRQQQGPRHHEQTH